MPPEAGQRSKLRLRDRLLAFFTYPVPPGPKPYRVGGYILKGLCWTVCLPILFGLLAAVAILPFIFAIMAFAAMVSGATAGEFLALFGELSALILLGLLGFWLMVGGAVIILTNSVFMNWTARRHAGLNGARVLGVAAMALGALRLYWMWLIRHTGDFVFSGVSENLLNIVVGVVLVGAGGAMITLSFHPEVTRYFAQTVPTATFTEVK